MIARLQGIGYIFFRTTFFLVIIMLELSNSQKFLNSLKIGFAYYLTVNHRDFKIFRLMFGEGGLSVSVYYTFNFNTEAY